MLIKHYKAILLILLSLFFVSCGGGDSGGSNPAPSAKVNVDFTTAMNGFTVTVVDKSIAENCTIAAQEWNFGDGSAVKKGATVTHPYAKAGSYDIVLTVTDSLGTTHTLTKTVTVTGETMTVTPDFTYVKNKFKVTFTDTSVVTGGSITSYSWSFGDGETDTAKNPVHEYQANGTYTVTLTVIDSAGKPHTASHGITISQANITKIDFSFKVIDRNVSFKNESVYAAGEIKSLVWNFGNGVTSTEGDSHYITYAEDKTYTVTLTVTDKYETEHAPVSHNVTVSMIDISKIDFEATVNGATAAFTNTSVYKEGDIVSWEWNFDNGQISDKKTPNPVTYSGLKTYNVTLTATDKYGRNTYKKTHPVQILVGSITPTFTAAHDGWKVTFTDSTILPAGTSITAREWDFGDKTEKATTASVTHDYKASGIYKIGFAVTDNFGRQFPSERQIIVTSSATVQAKFSYTINGREAKFKNESTIASGTATYNWNFGDGSTQLTGTSPTYTYPKGGKYTVTLTAQDSLGKEDTFVAQVATETFQKILNNEVNDTTSTTLGLTHSGDIYVWGNIYLGMPQIKEIHTPQKLDIGEKAADIATGTKHMLVATENGKVYAWGKNDDGQLGLGDIAESDKPTAISFPPEAKKIIAVASSYSHSLALTEDGKVYAWGSNSDGQLGLGNTNKQRTPQLITSLSNIVYIFCGSGNTFAIDNNGNAWGWGWNSNLRLIGTNQANPSFTTPQPINVGNLAGKKIKQIAGTSSHTIAVTADGDLYTWGSNANNQLGRTPTVENPAAMPTALTKSAFGGKNITFAATSLSSNSSLAIDSDGNFWSWGSNSLGNLGNGTTDMVQFPAKISGITNAVFTSGNVNNSFVITSSGTAYGFGLNNGYALGDGTNTQQKSKVKVVERGEIPADMTLNFKFVPAEGVMKLYNTSIIKHGLESYYWVINGNIINDKVPSIPYDGVSDVTAKLYMKGISGITPDLTKTFGKSQAYLVARGARHALATADTTKVYAWGYNDGGRLGLDHNEEQRKPHQPVDVLKGVWELYAGQNMSFAVMHDGKLYAWGGITNGNAGTGKASGIITTPTLVNVGSGEKVKHMAVSGHAVAVTQTDKIYVWGDNNYGQLGLGNTTQQNTPVELTTITGLTNIQKVSVWNHSLLLANGKVYSWGDNSQGQLGRTGDQKIPALVDAPTGRVDNIAAGSSHSLLLIGNEVYAWGKNDNGQLGLGADNYDDKTVPTKIPFFSGKLVVTIYADNSYSAAITYDGKLWMWGANHGGVPTEVTGVTIIKALSDKFATSNHSHIVNKGDGTLITWGNNADGQLGLGDKTKRDTPIPLPFIIEK